MKVKESQIPEESGKAQYKKKMKTGSKGDLFDDKEDKNEPKRLKKTMINFQEEGVSISAYDLHTIEKDTMFVEKPKAHWEYGIIINKGLTPGNFITKIDLSMWYISEKVRDEKMKKLLEILKIEGLSVIEI
jgi:hypothetical protein